LARILKTKVEGAIKSDEHFKTLLRSFRKILKTLFLTCKKADGSLLSKGHTKWQDEEKWFLRVRIFLEERLNLVDVSEREVAIAILLIYPAMGPSSGSDPVNKFQGKSNNKRLL